MSYYVTHDKLKKELNSLRTKTSNINSNYFKVGGYIRGKDNVYHYPDVDIKLAKVKYASNTKVIAEILNHENYRSIGLYVHFEIGLSWNYRRRFIWWNRWL